jgi:hypothetical protein
MVKGIGYVYIAIRMGRRLFRNFTPIVEFLDG